MSLRKSTSALSHDRAQQLEQSAFIGLPDSDLQARSGLLCVPKTQIRQYW
jgi:hypothetical protein